MLLPPLILGLPVKRRGTVRTFIKEKGKAKKKKISYMIKGYEDDIGGVYKHIRSKITE